MSRAQSRVLAVATIVVLACLACGRARPYRAMAKTAASEESVFAQFGDDHLKVRIRETILLEGETLGITPYVYMGHAFLVGFVPDDELAARLTRRVQAIEGVRDVRTYLPLRPSGSAGARVADDATLKAKVKAALATARDVVLRIDVEALAGHVVLLGVVSSPEAVAAAGDRARQVAGVTGVTNFLLTPEPGYESLRPKLR